MRAARCGLFIRGGNICIFHPSPSLQANLPNPSSLLSLSPFLSTAGIYPGRGGKKKGLPRFFSTVVVKSKKTRRKAAPFFRGRPLKDLICMSRCCLLPPSSFLFSPSPGYRWRKRRKGGRTEVIIGFPLPRGRPPPPSFLSSSKVRGEGREGTKAEEVSPANGAGLAKDLNNFKLNNDHN